MNSLKTLLSGLAICLALSTSFAFAGPSADQQSRGYESPEALVEAMAAIDLTELNTDAFLDHFASLGSPEQADIAFDMDGTARPQGGTEWDIGAFEKAD